MDIMTKLEKMKKEDVNKHIKCGTEYQVRFVDKEEIKDLIEDHFKEDECNHDHEFMLE